MADGENGDNAWGVQSGWETNSDGTFTPRMFDGNNFKVMRVEVGQDLYLELKGDVYLYDRLFIGSSVRTLSDGSSYIDHPGKTTRLHVKNVAGKPVHIYQRVYNSRIGYKGYWVTKDPTTGATANHTGQQVNSNVMFSVWGDAELIIEGTPDAPIIIDGGRYDAYNSATWVEGTSATQDTGTPTKEIEWGLIESTGKLTLKNVIIENVLFNSRKSPAGECSVIKLHPWGADYKMGKTTLDNVEIRNVESPNGGGCALMCYDATKGRSENNRETSKILMKNCKIHNCTQRGGSPKGTGSHGYVTAGIIRFRGDWVGDLEMDGCEVYENSAPDADCAGVHWNAIGYSNDPAQLIVKGCYFHDNYTYWGGAAMQIDGICDFQSPPTTFENNKAERSNGGAILVIGPHDDDPITMTDWRYEFNENCIFKYNQAGLARTYNSQGGAISFQLKDGTKFPANSNVQCVINGAQFTGNRANYQGGAVYIHNKITDVSGMQLSVELNSGTFIGNKVGSGNENDRDEDYGDLDHNDETGYSDVSHYIAGGALFSHKVPIKTTGNVVFEGNHARDRGGAIAFEKAKFDCGNLTFRNNTAYDGGAVSAMGTLFVEDHDNVDEPHGWLNIDNATFEGNTATRNGGGIFARLAEINIKNLTMTDNHARCKAGKYEGGGGIYAFQKCPVTITNCTMTGNTAMQAETDPAKSYNGRGGAIFLYMGGTLNIGAGGGKAEFVDNKSSCGGGAVFFMNNWTLNNRKDFQICSISNALFRGNGCPSGNGGALGIDGSYPSTGGDGYNISVTLENNTIENNYAQLGGAIMVQEGKINYNGGLIRNNKANNGAVTPTTALDGEMWNPAGRISGFGGGVLVASDGAVNFGGSSFGIYGNRAYTGGDDIATSKASAKVTLPDVQSLNIEGSDMNVPKSAIKWMEDYNSADGNYTSGIHSLSASAGRYRDLMTAMSPDLGKIGIASGTYTGYLMATLGYEFIFVDITKKGLRKGETAIFDIKREDGTSYMKVALTNESGDKDTTLKKTVALTPGKWTVSETAWSWAYSRSADVTQTLSYSVTNNRVFSFSNTYIDSTDTTAPHAESYKVNEF
ncbi:MAG: hypothetical protein ACI31A_07810 [Candidatus Limisoma sp.]